MPVEDRIPASALRNIPNLPLEEQKEILALLEEYEKAERHWKHAAKLVRSLGAFC